MRYFTTKQTANLLGYNDDSYIRRLVLNRKLPARKIGKQWTISEESIHKFKLNNDIKSKYKALLSFNQELRILADKILDRDLKMVGPKDMFAAFALGKGYKTHGAVLLLSQNGYGEDASILARSLFDLLVNLRYILADQTDERAYRYFRYDSVLMEKMLSYAKGKPKILAQIIERENNPLPGDSTRKEVEKQARLANDKYKYSNNGWSDKSLYDMAKEIDRLDSYQTVYRLQCQLDHNNSRSINEYAKDEGGGIIFNIGQSENWVEESLVIVFDFYYSILVTVDQIFKLNLVSEIKKLEDRYVSELSIINKKQ